MNTSLRKIVRIDEDKCNGCGLCVPQCEEGALQIVDGKAKLMDDKLCDGLGNCLGDCPRDAIEIIERQAPEFDEVAVKQRQEQMRTRQHAHSPERGCPGAAMMDFARDEDAPAPTEPTAQPSPSALRQWPVQLHLVPPSAPYLDGADLLLCADCVPFALADFHQQLLAGRRVLIGCPKLDDGQAYLQKLTAVLRENDIQSLTVAHMEVPCCFGLVAIARRALEQSGSEAVFRTVEAGIDGQCSAPVAAEE